LHFHSKVLKRFADRGAVPLRTAFTLCAIVCVTSVSCAQFLHSGQGSSSLRVSDQLVVNLFESDPAVLEPHLTITDVEGSGPVVNVQLFDEYGRLLDQEAFTLGIFGKANYNPAERLTEKRFRGSIRINADGGNVAAQYWKFHRDPALTVYNTAIPVADGAGAEALLCQHFVADPDPRIRTRLVLVNPGTDTVRVAITFYKDTGKQLSRDKYRIAPNALLEINPVEANEGCTSTGLVYCEVLGAGRITGEYWQTVEHEQYQVSLPLEVIPKRARDW
jgi:hypothetical protein